MDKLENTGISTKEVEQEGSCQLTQEDTQSSHSSEHSPQPNVPQLINLRDRAAQVALNFAGQTISSYDGTYDLLIDFIYDALLEVAQSKDMVVEEIYIMPAKI